MKKKKKLITAFQKKMAFAPPRKKTKAKKPEDRLVEIVAHLVTQELTPKLIALVADRVSQGNQCPQWHLYTNDPPRPLYRYPYSDPASYNDLRVILEENEREFNPRGCPGGARDYKWPCKDMMLTTHRADYKDPRTRSIELRNELERCAQARAIQDEIGRRSNYITTNRADYADLRQQIPAETEIEGSRKFAVNIAEGPEVVWPLPRPTPGRLASEVARKKMMELQLEFTEPERPSSDYTRSKNANGYPEVVANFTGTEWTWKRKRSPKRTRTVSFDPPSYEESLFKTQMFRAPYQNPNEESDPEKPRKFLYPHPYPETIPRIEPGCSRYPFGLARHVPEYHYVPGKTNEFLQDNQEVYGAPINATADSGRPRKTGPSMADLPCAGDPSAVNQGMMYNYFSVGSPNRPTRTHRGLVDMPCASPFL